MWEKKRCFLRGGKLKKPHLLQTFLKIKPVNTQHQDRVVILTKQSVENEAALKQRRRAGAVDYPMSIIHTFLVQSHRRFEKQDTAVHHI